MINDQMTKNCRNCNALIESKFCPECEQPAVMNRINRHYSIHEIEYLLHFEKGILYTVREMMLRPGRSVRHFIEENRSRLVKPVIFIIITSLVYTVINHLFHIEEEYVQFEGNMPATSAMINWFQAH